jgi:hypothetical protein
MMGDSFVECVRCEERRIWLKALVPVPYGGKGGMPQRSDIKKRREKENGAWRRSRK